MCNIISTAVDAIRFVNINEFIGYSLSCIILGTVLIMWILERVLHIKELDNVEDNNIDKGK
jgi:hypothetical protein